MRSRAGKMREFGWLQANSGGTRTKRTLTRFSRTPPKRCSARPGPCAALATPPATRPRRVTQKAARRRPCRSRSVRAHRRRFRLPRVRATIFIIRNRSVVRPPVATAPAASLGTNSVTKSAPRTLIAPILAAPIAARSASTPAGTTAAIASCGCAARATSTNARNVLSVRNSPNCFNRRMFGRGSRRLELVALRTDRAATRCRRRPTRA